MDSPALSQPEHATKPLRFDVERIIDDLTATEPLFQMLDGRLDRGEINKRRYNSHIRHLERQIKRAGDVMHCLRGYVESVVMVRGRFPDRIVVKVSDFDLFRGLSPDASLTFQGIPLVSYDKAIGLGDQEADQ